MERMAVRLGENVVWERPEIRRLIRSEPCFSAFGPLVEVFASDN